MSIPIAGISEWVSISGDIAASWGELLFLANTVNKDHSLNDLRERIENKFKNEIINYYDDTAYGANLPVQWKILERIRRDTGRKKAIICFDCMGFEEWNILKQYLNTHGILDFEVGYSLAILPTETNFSRTTIFSGRTPKRTLDSGVIEKMDTRHEEKLFKQALKKYNVDENNIFYQRSACPNGLQIDFNSFDDFEWIGLVFTFMDTLTHNSLMTKSKLIRDVQEFLDRSDVFVLLRKLLDQGFQVYLVSDHGSIHAEGNGVRVGKDLVNQKARRYIIFDHKELAKEFITENRVLLQFKNVIGEKWLLLLTGNEMFGNKGHNCLTHGGISIEEEVVPFVKVKER